MAEASLSTDEIDSLLGGLGEDESSSEGSDDLLSSGSDSDNLSTDELSSLLGGGESESTPAPTTSTPQTPSIAMTATPTDDEIIKELPPIQPENLLALQEVPIDVVVELGRTVKMVKEILAIGEGSIIELDKAASEPVDLLVNNKVIGKGEVVVVDENFGVRITKMLHKGKRDA